MESLAAVDPDEVRLVLTNFLADYAERSGATGAVVGLSGGLDSALATAIAADALGPDNVLALLMPHASSDPRDAEHAHAVAEALGVATETVDITAAVDAIHGACAGVLAAGDDVADNVKDNVAAHNIKPRVRMTILYAHANATNRLVLGTGNKSELLTGYFTKHGDGAADVYPLGDLYKTHVRQVARAYPIPDDVVEKPPTAGLYPGQTDADELGLPYEALDRVLATLEAGHDAAHAARATGVAPEEAAAVSARVRRTEHKRRPLVIPKLSFRTPGLDWRAPRITRPTKEP